MSTAEAVALAKAAEQAGCAGLMVLPPYVYSTDWREMKAHIETVLRATRLSCMLYNNPIAYKTDFLPTQIAELARDCDVLIHMCHFLSGTALNREIEKRNTGHLELARLGERANVRNLVVSHIAEQFDRPGMRERVVREMAGVYQGNLFFGEDLMEIPVGDPRAARLD